jgi:hypothetical protein
MTHPRRPGDPRADDLRARYAAVFGTAGRLAEVESIAEDLLGLAIGHAPLGVSGMLIPARREIWIDQREAGSSPERRRFTIAHEIGHWICHVREGRGGEIECRIDPASSAAVDGSDPREREANVFAASLLMPEDAVRAAWDAGVDAVGLRALLGVSEPAMAWRLYNLGLVADPPAPA